MSPEKILLDPVVAPVALGMLIRAKDFVINQGLIVVVTASLAMGGVFYTVDDTKKQLTIMESNMKDIQTYMLSMQKDIYAVKQDVALTKNDIQYISSSLASLTSSKGIITFKK